MALEHRDAISPAIAMRQGNSKRQLASHSLLSSRPLNCQQEEMDKWIKSFLRISNTSKPLPAHGEVSESIHRTDEDDDDDDDDDKAVDRSSTFSSQDSDSDERLSSRPHSDSSEDKTDSKSSSLAATTTRVVRVGFLQGPVVSKLRLHRVVAVLGGGVIVVVVVVIFISVTSVT